MAHFMFYMTQQFVSIRISWLGYGCVTEGAELCVLQRSHSVACAKNTYNWYVKNAK